MTSGREQALHLMREDGANDAAIAVFAHAYDQLASGATGLVPEASIDPVTDLPHADDIDADDDEQRAALDATVVLRLNGGLGTSMGMARAKSLLPVRGDLSFLDVTVRQVLAARAATGARLPLLLMNSFSTRADTLAALAAYPDLAVGDLPLDFVQSREPKLRADDLTPVDWPADPRLEWCPPGHGDIYPSLLASGLLDRLVDDGYRYLAVANADNLGAAPDGRLAAWFAASGAPYAAEVTARTPMDRKGGHLARHRSDGRLVLRDTAQTPADEMHHFTDEHRHPYAHCNNLWLDLRVLRDVLAGRGGVLGLPLIRNAKTVDPRDPASTPVVQVESAMGAAIEVFEGATAVVVPRSRFLPVKGTSELVLVRSDVYGLDERYRLVMDPRRAGRTPVVDLANPCYRTVDGLDARMPDGAPSLVGAGSLRVEGDVMFAGDVVVTGDVAVGADASGRVLHGALSGCA